MKPLSEKALMSAEARWRVGETRKYAAAVRNKAYRSGDVAQMRWFVAEARAHADAARKEGWHGTFV